MRLQTLSFTVLSLLVSGCATPPPPPVEIDPLRPPMDASCPTEPGALMLATTPDIARQGSSLLIRPSLYRGPMGPLPMPTACLTDVMVSPASAARLTPGRDQIVLSPDAPPGTVVTLSARYRDDVDAHEIIVAGRDQVVLTGTWRQDRVKCDPGHSPGEPVRELRIDDKGTFGVTYQPFESYTDFWGNLTFEPSTGALAMTRTGGNFTPQILDGDGTARLDGDRRLILEGVYLGDRNERNFEPRRDDKGQYVVNPDGTLIVDRPVCTYEFVR